MEDIVLRDTGRSQKDRSRVTPPTGGTWRSPGHRDRRQDGGGQGLGVASGHRASVSEDERVLGTVVGTVIGPWDGTEVCT